MKETERLVKTPEEAIEVIKANIPTSGYQMLQESLDMAIDALEKQKTKENKKADALVVFYFKTSTATGIANAYMELDSFPCTGKEVEEIIALFRKGSPDFIEDVCILNIIPLKGEK